MFAATVRHGQQTRLLEGDAVVLVAAGAVGRLAEDLDRAAGGRVEVGDEPHQRRLAAPGRPDERDELALADRQVDVRRARAPRPPSTGTSSPTPRTDVAASGHVAVGHHAGASPRR